MKKYKVKTPHGVFVDGEWDRAEDIPEVLMDRWEHRFFVEDGEIVEVTREENETQRETDS